ncbi:MAG: DUF4290 domain-containing protein [Bacteroidetes bacterium]|jgi:hypothetical protein|nr:DUF4290 domain-containing protein [Bacteroidota bacterium]
MPDDGQIIDHEVGRNAELFSHAVADLDTPEDRYPYLRILISIVEQAHPEWKQAGFKDEKVADLLALMSDSKLDKEEVKAVVHMRDAEQKHKRGSRKRRR